MRIARDTQFTFTLVAIALLVSAACGAPKEAPASQASAATYARLTIGNMAPAYVTPTLAGDTVRIGSPDEPITVLNVWATWCVSCREEMQDLQQLHNEYQSKNVRVLGVSVDEAPELRVRKFVEKEKLTFSLAHDREGRVQQLYQVSGIPNTFIIGRDGRILWKRIGNLHGVVDSLRRVLNESVKQ